MPIRKSLLFFFLLSVPLNSAIADVMDDAHDAYKRGDPSAALRLSEPLAMQGDADAQALTGAIYYFGGNGVTKDSSQALKWLRLASSRGKPFAERILAAMYVNGDGVTQDYAEAIRLRTLAAEQGDMPSEMALGATYQLGLGVPVNRVEAFKWYSLAAEQGSADAEYLVGDAYNTGKGVEKNEFEAVKWWQKSVSQNNAMAKFELGRAYARGTAIIQDAKKQRQLWSEAAGQGNPSAEGGMAAIYLMENNAGKAAFWAKKAARQGDLFGETLMGSFLTDGFGVRRDLVEAYMWYNLAASQGGTEAATQRTKLSQNMTAKQIQDGQRLSRGWKPEL